MTGSYHIHPSARMVFRCAFLLISMLLLNGTASAEDSGCVVCHTDDELLTENLGPQSAKKSSLQAGAG